RSHRTRTCRRTAAPCGYARRSRRGSRICRSRRSPSPPTREGPCRSARPSRRRPARRPGIYRLRSRSCRLAATSSSRQFLSDGATFGIVVIAQRGHRVASEADQLVRRSADALLAVDVVRWVRPVDELALTDLAFVVDGDPASAGLAAVVEAAPVLMPVRAAQRVRHAPRL